MLVNRLNSRVWDVSGIDGIAISTVWRDAMGDGGYFAQFKSGAQFPLHAHDAWEQIIVISGMIRFGDVTLLEGDFLQVDSSDEHDACALKDTVLFVSHRGGIQLK